MKTITLTIFSLLAVSALYSQDLAGQWNGALNVQGTQLRLVFHVTKTGNKFKATMDSPDQNAAGIPIDSVHFNRPNLKFEITGIKAVFEGVLSGKQINGNWMQSGQTLPLVLSKKETSPGKPKTAAR